MYPEIFNLAGRPYTDTQLAAEMDRLRTFVRDLAGRRRAAPRRSWYEKEAHEREHGKVQGGKGIASQWRGPYTGKEQLP